MEEIKVGEYFRDFDGGIDQIKFIVNTLSNKKLIGFQKRNYSLSENGLKKIVKKYSFNIIDLIQVGDYVNGYKVSLISKDIEKFVQCDYPVQEGTTNHYKFYEKAIESIVTKEQFAAAEYRLEE